MAERDASSVCLSDPPQHPPNDNYTQPAPRELLPGRKSFDAASAPLASYSYTDDRNHYLERLDYGNGDSVEYTYDKKGRLTTEVYEDGATVEYAYDSEGELAQIKDSDSGITRKFFYDLTRRMGEYTEVGTGLQNRVRYTYDAKGNFSELRQEINGTTRVTSYDYDDDNRVTGHTSGTDGKSFDYDAWGRLSGSATKIGNDPVYGSSYTYRSVNGKPTGQVEELAIDAAGYDVTYTYTYDANGNILSISDGTYTTRYTYDSANQLTREDNQKAGYTYLWGYDVAGNLLDKNIYTYTLGTPEDFVDYNTYRYGTNGWGDVLVYSDWYGGTPSDEIGNLTYNRGHSYTWRHGRELATLNNWTFTYDADGLRTKRTDGTNTYSYSYIDGQLWYMKAGNQELFISWDAAGNPWTLRTGGQTYYYVTNLQGDVIAILNGSGDPMVTYTYDAWGNILEIGGEDANTLGRTNPLRYRGYVYDQETGLYYLQSRYYDPEMGRFISADVYYSTGQGFVGNNMFAYCGNNPVSFVDSTGTLYVAALQQTRDGVFRESGTANKYTTADAIRDTKNAIKDFFNNTEEQPVVDAEIVAFYNGHLVIKVPGNSSFSFGVIFFGKDCDANLLRHEYGHVRQFQELGGLAYAGFVAIPSIIGYHSYNPDDPVMYYYSLPWELEANALGNVHDSLAYSSHALQTYYVYKAFTYILRGEEIPADLACRINS